MARTIGMGTARIAEANRELVVRTLMQPGDTERDLALRFAAAAEHMLPLFEPTLVYAFRAHMLEQIRRDVIGAADLASGEIGGDRRARGLLRRPGRASPSSARRSRPRSSAWSPAASRRWRRAVAEPPVRLVKTDRRRGDAGLRRAASRCSRRRCGWSRPPRRKARSSRCLRAGIAYGPALTQSGDYYGRPVNLASRITGVAKPGSVLVDAADQGGGGRGLRLLLRRRAPPQGLRLPRQALPRPPRRAATALGRLAAGDEQVVEELGGEVGLEQAGVDLLQGDVAAEGEAAPAPGDRFGLGARLDRAQAPAPGVGEQLLAADAAVLEAGVAQQAAQVGGGEGVDVDLALQRVAVGLLGLGRRRGGCAPTSRRQAGAASIPARFGTAASRSP